MNNLLGIERPLWRPLSFGELFDRAIALYVRNFLPIVGITLVIAIPDGIEQYLVDFGRSASLGRPAFVLGQSPIAGVALAIGILIWFVAQPFVYNAIAVGVFNRYRGEAVAFGACYRVALRAWPSTLGVLGYSVLIAMGLGLALVFAAMILGAFLGVLELVIVVPCAVIVVLPLAAMLGLAQFAVAIERTNASTAIGTAYRRIFQGEFWRALGVMLCAAGGVYVLGLIDVLIRLVLSGPLFPFADALVEAATCLLMVPWLVIVMAVYYLDIRIRQEGLDFEHALGAPADLEAIGG